MNAPTVRLLAPDDWDRVRAIYEEGIATRNATFETAAPPWSVWDGSHLPDHRLVAISDDVVWRDTLFLERRSATVGGRSAPDHG